MVLGSSTMIIRSSSRRLCRYAPPKPPPSSSSSSSGRRRINVAVLGSGLHNNALPCIERRNDDNDDDDNDGNNNGNAGSHYRSIVHPVRGALCNSLVYNNGTNNYLSTNSLTNGSSTTTMATIRQYHTTPANERGAAIVLGLGAIAATAKAGQYAVQGYNEWREQRRSDEERFKAEGGGGGDAAASKSEHQKHASAGGAEDADAGGASANAGASDGKSSAEDGKDSSTSSDASGKRENIFSTWFNMSVGSKYYEGGFEDKMTRKEAALILGVRESSAPKRIKEAHRKLLILNHPDTGGSTYMAGKINEAKELLLKGRKA